MINSVSVGLHGGYNMCNRKNNTLFGAKNHSEPIRVVSLRDADNLKYDVEYSKTSRFKNDVKISGDNIDIDFKHGLNSSQAIGKAYNHNINLEYSYKGFNPNSMLIKGQIDGLDIRLKYNINGNNANIEGDISSIDKETITFLNMLARDYSDIAREQLNMATMIMLL